MRLRDFSDDFFTDDFSTTVMGDQPYGVDAAQQTMPIIDYGGTEPDVSTAAPLTGDGALMDFFRQAGSVLNQVGGLYSTVEQQKIAAQRIAAGQAAPMGTHYMAQPAPQPSLFSTPQGKMLLPIGLALGIFMLAN